VGASSFIENKGAGQRKGGTSTREWGASNRKRFTGTKFLGKETGERKVNHERNQGG